MEPKFQTSFIPKKQVASVGGGMIGAGPMQQKPKSSLSSLYMAIGVIAFVVSILAVGGSYFWKSYLQSANDKYKEDLAQMEKKFDLASIEKLKARNVQIDSAKKLLSNHISSSRIFNIIQDMTISDVRFLSMDFKGSAQEGKYTINMKGQGKNLAAVAYQSDVLSDLSKYGISSVISNPIVSSPSVEQNGAVSFSFSAEIKASGVSYKDSVNASSNDSQDNTGSVEVNPNTN